MLKRKYHIALIVCSIIFSSVILLAKAGNKPNTFIQSAHFSLENHHSNSEENYLIRSEKLTVSNLYPNPAFDYVDLDVQINANFSDVRLLIFNILGQQVKEVNLDVNLRTVRVNLRDLNPGMYPYQLVVDGKSLATKKLIVR